ncbi:hypothetical protein PSPO01_02494 [Paraphaeosphaeria sporulosa]
MRLSSLRFTFNVGQCKLNDPAQKDRARIQSPSLRKTCAIPQQKQRVPSRRPVVIPRPQRFARKVAAHK